MRLIKLVYGLLGGSFLMVPMIAILPIAFNGGVLLNYPMNGVSLRWFTQLFEEEIWIRAIFNSLFIGSLTAVIATALGTLAALGMRGQNGLFYGTCRVVFLLPMVAPVVVLGVGLQILFSRTGLLNTYTGVIIAHTVVALPFVVVSVGTALSGIDRTTERAASSLGASPMVVFRRVTFPLAMPGVVSGAIFSFATSLDEVILMLFVGGANQRTVAREMFAQLRDNLTPVIAAVAFLFVVGTMCLALVVLLLRQRRSVDVMAE
jgi:putative spermidine/putrescine transport system permease protein